MILSHAELTRYSRHLLLPGFHLEGQQKLKAAKVLVVGAGGLGRPVAIVSGSRRGRHDRPGGF